MEALKVHSLAARRLRSIDTTGITHGSFVIHEPPTFAWLPAAATTITPFFAARRSADSNVLSPGPSSVRYRSLDL